MSILTTYLEELQRIRASGLGTIERSYYPALATLLQALGERLSPRVTSIHDSKDRGVGHPDFVLEVENTHDLRAAVEVKGADADLTIRYNGVGRYEPPIPGAAGGVSGHDGRLWWNDVGYWANVAPAVWAFTIGGYPVIKKWLDYRHESKLGRPLRPAEVRYVSEMIQRIATLLALGAALDANYAAVKGLAPTPNPAR